MTETHITIGELSRRSGVAASALRYYEQMGLIHSIRTSGGQRRFVRSTLRRVAFVRAAQRVGLSLDEARDALSSLREDRAPTAEEWAPVARAWQDRIDAQIDDLRRMRDNLDGCIGCGCLSLTKCAIYNPSDGAARRGSGARYLLGDRSADVMAEAVAGAS